MADAYLKVTSHSDPSSHGKSVLFGLIGGIGFAVSNFINSRACQHLGINGLNLIFFGAFSSFFLCHIWIHYTRKDYEYSKHFDMYLDKGKLCFKRIMLTFLRAISICLSYVGIFSTFYVASLSAHPINSGILQAVFASGLIWSIVIFYHFFDQNLTSQIIMGAILIVLAITIILCPEKGEHFESTNLDKYSILAILLAMTTAIILALSGAFWKYVFNNYPGFDIF